MDCRLQSLIGGIRDTSAVFYLLPTASNRAQLFFFFFNLPWEKVVEQSAGLLLCVRAFLKTRCAMILLFHSKIIQGRGYFLQKTTKNPQKQIKKNPWINLLVPIPFQICFWTFINFYFKHNSLGLWKPTEKLEWTPTISWSGYNLYPVRNGSLKVYIHFHFWVGFLADLILYHHLAYETPIGTVWGDLLHSYWQLIDRYA